MSVWNGRRIARRDSGRVGVVVGDSGGRDLRVRYDDGKRDAWVQRSSIQLLGEADEATSPS